jgi:VCBS repeat-containing protein
VNDAPACTTPQSGSTNEDTVLIGSVVCTDIDSTTLTYSKVGNPSHGTVTVNSDGAFTYTPAANYNGSDSFTFKANDGNLDSNVATFNITVSAVNDAPVAANDSYSTNEDTALNVSAPGLLGNDLDVDGDSITSVLVTNVSHGTLTLNSNGSFTFTPAANYNGTDSFTYKVSDGNLGSNTVTVSITVNTVNDAPVAVNDSATIAKNGSGVIFILTNDTDIEGDSLTVTNFTQPAHGTVTYSTKNKNFRYIPARGFTGTDTFTYPISDGHGGSATATVTITVQ